MPTIKNEVAGITRIEDAKNTSTNVDSTQEVNNNLTPELVIALCGPIGSPLHETAEKIKDSLNSFGYKSLIIRLSELILLNENFVNVPIDTSSEFYRMSTLIQAGDELRKKYGNDVLAKLAIAKISAYRKKFFEDFEDHANESTKDSKLKIRSHRTCHIIDSIKNLDELKLLRLIYGEALFAIGVFSPLAGR